MVTETDVVDPGVTEQIEGRIRATAITGSPITPSAPFPG